MSKHGRDYKRDGEAHTVKGAPGHALVYKFSRGPGQDDFDEGEIDPHYLKSSGIYVAQLDNDSRPGECLIQSVEVSFWDLASDKIVGAIKSAGLNMPAGVTAVDVATKSTGKNLMDLGLALISYGYYGDYREDTADSMKDGLESCERAAENAF